MTEQEWLRSADPERMLWHVREQASARKLRLFAIAWARQWLDRMEDDRSRVAVDVAERFVEDAATHAELLLAYRQAKAVCDEYQLENCRQGRASRWGRSNRGAQQAWGAARSAQDAVEPQWTAPQTLRPFRFSAGTTWGFQRSDLLRDLFGNPFRIVTIDRTTRTSTVQSLAQGFHEHNDLTDLPILGDALEEAGCTNVDILDHCRQSEGHVRGCWVVDLIIGKA